MYWQKKWGLYLIYNLSFFNIEVVATSLKSYSMGNVCWVTEIDLCFACAAFRKGTIQTVLNITFNWKSSQLNLFWNQYNILRINIDIYLSFTETLIWPVTNYWSSFLCFVDAFPNYLLTVEYWYMCINQMLMYVFMMWKS